MVKYLRDSKQGYDLLNQGADKLQTRAWSSEIWGSKEEPGQIQVYSFNLGVFASCFERQIGLTALKAMKSVPEWIERMSLVNDQMCETSLEFRRADALNEPNVPLKELQARIANTPSRAQRLKEGFGTPALPKTPSYETPGRFTRTDNHHHNYNNNNNNNNGNNHSPYPRRDHAPRQAAIEEQEYDMDDSYYAGETSARVAPEPHLAMRGDYDPEGEMVYNDTEMFYETYGYPDMPRIMALPGGSAQKNLYDPKKKVGNPEKPCYVHFYGRCNDDCGGYSHKDEDMVKLRQQQMARLYNSMYGGYEKLQADLLKLKERPPQLPSPARQDQRHGAARMSAVENQPPNDPSALYGATAQGLGPLPGSS